MKHQPAPDRSSFGQRVLTVLWIAFAIAMVPGIGAVAVICWRIAGGDTGCPR